MPEMRSETEREARRKGISGESPMDPYDLTSFSKPSVARSAGENSAAKTDTEGPHLRSARAERLRTGPHLKRGESGGPS